MTLTCTECGEEIPGEYGEPKKHWKKKHRNLFLPPAFISITKKEMTPDLPTIKKSEFHPKGWGYELWIANNKDYCGKLLFFEKGKKCSYHSHKIKTETFYVQSGKMIVRYGYDASLDKAKETLLTPGDVFDIPLGLYHQMEAVEDTELFEFSTQHFEEDSYRSIKGD